MGCRRIAPASPMGAGADGFIPRVEALSGSRLFGA
jgi:hypothetical protein